MSNKKFAIAFGALAVVCAASSSASAYIDPGTGMTFISGIGAFIAGLFAFAFGAIVVTFKRWKMFFKNLFSKSDSAGGDHPR